MIGAKEMSTSEAQKRAVAKYQDSKDLIKFQVPRGKKAEYQALALRSGAKSLTEYLNTLLEAKLEEEQK